MNITLKSYLPILALALCSAAQADPVQSTTITGDNATAGDQQLIGDTNASENKTSSQSTQLGNSANANGATITTGVDTRDQNTVNSTTTSAGGAGGGGGSAAGGHSSSSSAGGNAAQRQGIEGSGNSDNRQASTLTTGPTTIAVDSADRSSSSYRAVAWAPVLHGPAAPALAAGALVVVPGQCGPRVLIVRRDVVGSRFGVLGGQQEVLQGQDEITAPAPEPFVQVGPYLLGHAVTTYSAVLGASSAASLSLAGYGKDGSGGQAGGSTGGALQQLTQRVTIRECVMAQAALAE